MKKVYEKPEIEKISFQAEEKVCAGLFADLFNLQFASANAELTRESVFDWGDLK